MVFLVYVPNWNIIVKPKVHWLGPKKYDVLLKTINNSILLWGNGLKWAILVADAQH